MTFAVELRSEWYAEGGGGHDARGSFEYEVGRAACDLGFGWKDAGDHYLLTVPGGTVVFGSAEAPRDRLPLDAEWVGPLEVSIPHAALVLEETVLPVVGTVLRISAAARREPFFWRIVVWPKGQPGARIASPGMWAEVSDGDTFQLEARSVRGEFQPFLFGTIRHPASRRTTQTTVTSAYQELREAAEDARAGYDLEVRQARNFVDTKDFNLLRAACWAYRQGMSSGEFTAFLDSDPNLPTGTNRRSPKPSGPGGLGYYILDIGATGADLDGRPLGGVFEGSLGFKDFQTFMHLAEWLCHLGFIRDEDLEEWSR